MDNNKWLDRWQKGETGFHEATPHPLLVNYLKNLNLSKGDRIFVPLCGASIDMYYLLEQGYYVIGCELSDIACKQFFKEHQLPYHVKKLNSFVCYENEKIQLFCGDIFQLNASIIGKVDAIYDRAALIALNKDQRISYIQKLQEILPNFKVLLITVSYDQSDGPPHSIDEVVVQSLFPDKVVTLLMSNRETPTVQRLRENGKSNVKEYVFNIN